MNIQLPTTRLFRESLLTDLTCHKKQPGGESLQDDNPLPLVHAGDENGDGAWLQGRPDAARVVREALPRLPNHWPEIGGERANEVGRGNRNPKLKISCQSVREIASYMCQTAIPISLDHHKDVDNRKN